MYLRIFSELNLCRDSAWYPAVLVRCLIYYNYLHKWYFDNTDLQTAHSENSYCLATPRQAVLPTGKKTNKQEAKVRGDVTCKNVGYNIGISPTSPRVKVWKIHYTLRQRNVFITFETKQIRKMRYTSCFQTSL